MQAQLKCYTDCETLMKLANIINVRLDLCWLFGIIEAKPMLEATEAFRQEPNWRAFILPWWMNESPIAFR